MAEYIEREAAINEIENADYSLIADDAESYKADYLGEIIKNIPAADVVPVARWIPVVEKLPEIGETVLVIASGWPKLRKELRGAVEIATLYATKPQPDWMLEAWPDWACPGVTHWMPLPEPPKNLIKEG